MLSLDPDTFYHIYNRGNNRENLFRGPRNYASFLNRYAKHVSPVADTFVYCLMPNHFHILLRIKSEEEWPNSKSPSRRFANLFSGYAKAVNRAYDRTGSLFQKPFGRVPITSPEQLEHVVCYIHRNPQHHGFVTDFRDYPHSSYHAFFRHSSSRLCREEVLAWFGSLEEFELAHQSYDDTNTDLPGLPISRSSNLYVYRHARRRTGRSKFKPRPARSPDLTKL